MKQLNKKYLLSALKHQNMVDSFSLGNDAYNIANFGTNWEHLRIVSHARWQQSGFLKQKLTKSQLMEYLRINNYEIV